MRSWEVLREASEHIGVKALAAKLKLSPALIYKWCQESSRTDPDPSRTTERPSMASAAPGKLR